MYYVNSNIENLERIFPEEDRKKFIRLDMNENPQGLPESFVRNVLDQISSDYIASYPYYGDLIRKISNHISINENQIVLTNGSDMAIKYVFHAFGRDGGELVSVFPTFEMYNIYSKMYGLNQRKIEYKNDFSIHIEEILNNINTNTNIVSLLNPNSPIGNSYSDEDIENIIKKAKKYGAIVIIDEAYYYFYNKTCIDYVNKYDNVIITRTFSKLCSIACCRVGFLVSNKKIIDYIKNVKMTFDVNGIGVKFAEAILDSPNVINELIETEKKGRQYILNELEKYRYEFYSENGNYVFIKTKNNPKKIYHRLKDRGILVKVYNYNIFKDYIRITTGSIEIMKKLMENLLIVDN